MRVTLSRVVGFRAMHRMYRRDLSDEENQAQFGWTADPPGHSHDYRCTVAVTGPVNDRHPMVMDLALLDQILEREVVARFDGRHLNTDVPELTDVLPTCEAIARDVYHRIAQSLPAGVTLAKVQIAEDATLYAECTGDA